MDDLLGLRHLQEQKYKKRLALGEDIQHLAKQKHNLTRIHVLTGVSKKNTGQLPQYYIENNHEGIVTKQMFREVQAEIARRNSKSAANQRKRHQGRYNSKYALSERLVCGDCGSPYKRVTWNIHGRKQIVWRCVNRLECGYYFLGK